MAGADLGEFLVFQSIWKVWDIPRFIRIGNIINYILQRLCTYVT